MDLCTSERALEWREAQNESSSSWIGSTILFLRCLYLEYIYIYIYIYVCVWVWVCVWFVMSAYIGFYKYVYVCACVCVCVLNPHSQKKKMLKINAAENVQFFKMASSDRLLQPQIGANFIFFFVCISFVCISFVCLSLFIVFCLFICLFLRLFVFLLLPLFVYCFALYTTVHQVVEYQCFYYLPSLNIYLFYFFFLLSPRFFSSFFCPSHRS